MAALIFISDFIWLLHNRKPVMSEVPDDAKHKMRLQWIRRLRKTGISRSQIESTLPQLRKLEQCTNSSIIQPLTTQSDVDLDEASLKKNLNDYIGNDEYRCMVISTINNINFGCLTKYLKGDSNAFSTDKKQYLLQWFKKVNDSNQLHIITQRKKRKLQTIFEIPKKRKIISDERKNILECEFLKNKEIDHYRAVEIAQQCNNIRLDFQIDDMDSAYVQGWFRQRLKKWKNEKTACNLGASTSKQS
ncbi:hypothetical protein B4U80_13660 [Leptotrombidium deliense]|uniref:Homeobox domain-containing protein n=1 Tax=Leptotrombidium deliense TaxID=299467 RepID=A0A443SNH4_9ACAR|nr:hypothetical protein B4U80_13660 [Leptotrombidium deliense]